MLHNDISHSLGGALRDENNAYISSSEESTELLINLFISSVSLNDHEVLLSTLISFSHSCEKETSDCGLITNCCHKQSSFTISSLHLLIRFIKISNKKYS